MEQRKDRRCDNKPVHAVKQTAMSGDEVAAVLLIEVPLDARLEKIAGLTYNGKDRRQQRGKPWPRRAAAPSSRSPTRNALSAPVR